MTNDYNIIKLFFIYILLIGCRDSKTLPFYNTADFTPIFIDNEKDIKDKISHTIADFKFKNHKNKTIDQKYIEGKIHVANFIFTNCGSICPVMTNHMKLIENEFINDPNFCILSYSVTPWIDSVSRLNQYAQSYNIKTNNWHLLTGSKSDIYSLARRSYFAEEDFGFSKDSTEFLHTEHFILVDKNKRIRGIYNGTLLLEIKQLIKDIHFLK